MLPRRPTWLAAAAAALLSLSVTKQVQGQMAPAPAPGPADADSYYDDFIVSLEPGTCTLIAPGFCTFNPCPNSQLIALDTCLSAPFRIGACEAEDGCQAITLTESGGMVCGLTGAATEADLDPADLTFLSDECEEGFPDGSECRETALRVYEALGCQGCVDEIEATQDIAEFCAALPDETCGGTELPCDEFSAAPAGAPGSTADGTLAGETAGPDGDVAAGGTCGLGGAAGAAATAAFAAAALLA